jgi:alpha-L-arabinofuranosidase
MGTGTATCTQSDGARFKNMVIRGVFWCVILTLLGTPLSAQNVSSYVRSASQEALIEVDASSPALYRIPRTVYGTFLEDIGRSIFGGVSAELLDNPSLEDYDASLSVLHRRFSARDYQRASLIGLPLPWLPLYWKQERRYEPRWGNAPNSSRYLYLMGMQGEETGIRQTVYLPIERERSYKGTLFVSSDEGSQTVVVSFRPHEQVGTVLAQESLRTPAAPGWHQLSFQLDLPPGAVAPLEPVDFAVSLHGNHQLSIDEILLYPGDAVDGLDPQVIAAAKALRSPLLRYGGNFTSSYHWQEGIGPLDHRPTMLNEAWGIPEYNLFGTDDLMTLCRLTGALPQICLNLGSGTVGEARDWVEYCTGSQTTPMGALRARNGHPAPYRVGAWELGNELWNRDDVGWQTPEGNARRYSGFYDAIRSFVPASTLIFATGADVDLFRDWNGALISRDGPELRYLTTHFVVGMDHVEDKTGGLDAVWRADLAVPVGVGRALHALKSQVDTNPATRGRVKLAYTEWLFTAPKHSPYPRWSNLGGALVAAGWMNMLLENAAFVPVSDMTGLVEFAGIHKRKGRVYVTPQYWTLWLYSKLAGDVPVPSRTTVREYDVHGGVTRVPEIANVPWLDVLATMDSHTHGLILFVVNRNWTQPIPASVRVQGFDASPSAALWTLTADSVLEENDAFNPNHIHPITTSLQTNGNAFRYDFPEHSLTVVVMAQR